MYVYVYIRTYVRTVHRLAPVTFSASLVIPPSAVCRVPCVTTLGVPERLQKVDQPCHDGVLHLLVPGQLLKQFAGWEGRAGKGRGSLAG